MMGVFFRIQLFYNDGGEHGDEVLYGTTDGKIGFVHLTRYIVQILTKELACERKAPQDMYGRIFLFHYSEICSLDGT